MDIILHTFDKKEYKAQIRQARDMPGVVIWGDKYFIQGDIPAHYEETVPSIAKIDDTAE